MITDSNLSLFQFNEIIPSVPVMTGSKEVGTWSHQVEIPAGHKKKMMSFLPTFPRENWAP